MTILDLFFGGPTGTWEIGKGLTSSGARPMFRFDQLIRSGMTVRDVKQRYPSTVPLFEQFGFRSVCDDCDIATPARAELGWTFLTFCKL